MCEPRACEDCGDEGQIVCLSGPTYLVQCVGCGAYGETQNTREAAIEWWNRNKPTLYPGDTDEPSSPDLAVRIVAAIEANLKDRRGISWDNLGDDDLIQSMRDELARVVQDVLAEPAKEGSSRDNT